jgi:hypothetical protein
MTTKTLKNIKDSKGFTHYPYTLSSKLEGELNIVCKNLDYLKSLILENGKIGDVVTITSCSKPSWNGIKVSI